MNLVSVQNLACPLDGLALKNFPNRSLVCSSGHSFDIARKGYINLLSVQDKSSKNPGDTEEMVNARKRFLNTGVYESISDRFNQIILEALTPSICGEQINILDAGCGEGYYLVRLLKSISAFNEPTNFSLVGMDISKPAIIAATKRNHQDITWIVGTNKNPPIVTGSVDSIFCIFGYPFYKSFKRILKVNGTVVLVEAGSEHLIELREMMYEDVRKDGPPTLTAAEQKGFRLVDEQTLKTKTGLLTNAQIKDLLAMTPHFYRITQERKNAVQEASGLNMTLHIVFRKLSLQ